MLVVISDLHLWDGTIGVTVAPQTFSLFASRLRELAFQASWRTDGKYRPIDNLDLLLLGDIIDPLQSTRWLSSRPGDLGFIRPWHDPQSPLFSEKLQEVTGAILAANKHSLDVIRRIGQGEAIQLLPATSRGKPSFYTRERISPKVRIHYMVGNHDWFYHVPGPAFDTIRKQIVDALGLSNEVELFAHDPAESPAIMEMFREYQFIARHGDIFDNFTYNREKGRDSAALSDIYSSEVVFRFPYELEHRMGGEVPVAMLDGIRKLTNVHPLLASPIWVRDQVNKHATSPAMAQKVKDIWDEIAIEFIENDIVRTNKYLRDPKARTALRLLITLSKNTSLQTIADVARWMQKTMWQGEISIARFARREPAIRHKEVRYVAYGHTHAHEVIALDNPKISPYDAEQVYFNTGTWGMFYNMVPRNTKKEATASHLLTCLALYKDNERGGRNFETWWGNFT